MARLKSEDLNVNIRVHSSDARQRILDLETGIRDETAQLKHLQNELKKVEKAEGANSAVAKEKRSQIEALTASIKKNKDALSRQLSTLKTSQMTIKELTARSKELSSVLRITAPDTKAWREYSRELQEVNGRLKQLKSGQNAVSGVITKIGLLGSGIMAAVQTVKSGISGAIRFASKAFGMIAAFEQANAELATILGKTAKEITDLTASAEALGRSTEYTASQVTMLQTELAKLGFEEAQIQAMQEPILHFATAMGADLPSAASFAGAALRIFGLQSGDAEEVLSMCAVAANKSALSFEYLNEAMSTAGPIAKAFGFSIEDIVALLGSLSNAGFDASSAATATRNILVRLADANGKLAKALGGPVKTLPELLSALKRLREEGVDLATTFDLVGAYSVSAFNTFLNSAEATQELRDSLDDVDGELQRIADERMNTVSGSIKLMQSAWEGFILSMSGSKGVIKSVIDFMTSSIEKFTEWLFPEARVQGAADEYAKIFTDEYNLYGANAANAKMQDWVNRSNADLERAEAGGKRRDIRKVTEDNEAIKTAAARVKALIEADLAEKEAALAAAEAEAAAAQAREANQKKAEQAALTEKAEADAAMKREKAEQDAARVAIEADKLVLKSKEGTLEGRLEIEERRYEEEKEKFKNHAEALEAAERIHQKNVQEIILDFENRDFNSAKAAYELERAELENHWLERLATVRKGSADEKELKRQMAQELAILDMQYLEATKGLLEDIIRTGKIAGIAIPEEQLGNFKKQLQDIIRQINRLRASSRVDAAEGAPEDAEGGLWSGTGRGDLFGISQDQWAQLFSNLENGTLKAQDLSNAFSAIGNMAQEGFSLVYQAIDMTNAKEDQALEMYRKNSEARKSALQKRLDAGLLTEEQYNAEVQHMEEAQDAYEEELAIRQAERDKRMSIAQAIINTALGVAKTLAEFGIPAGIAPAAIMSAMGAAQVALIAATPVTGREEGGFIDGKAVVRRAQDGKLFPARLSPDARGFVSSPTVLVGENGTEYVVPAEALENPSIRPFISAMETARRAGTLRSLRLEAVQPASIRGRASGGFVDGSPDFPTAGMGSGYAELLEAVRSLNRILSGPITAEVSMLGRKGIVEGFRKYDRQKNRGSL